MSTATKNPTKKKADPKAKKHKPEWSKEELVEYANRMGDLEDSIRKHDAEIEDLRQDLKSEKELRAGKVQELRRLAFEKKHPEAHPLFKASANGQHKGNGQPAVAGPTEEDKEWRGVAIREAMPKLPKKVYEGMDAKNLKTMGELCDWRNKDGGANWITDLPGVGKAAADKIDDAIEAFFDQRRKRDSALATAAEMKKDGGAGQPDILIADIITAAAGPEKLRWLELFAKAGISTVAKLEAKAVKDRMTLLDAARSLGFNVLEADMIQDAVRKANREQEKATAGKNGK